MAIDFKKQALRALNIEGSDEETLAVGRYFYYVVAVAHLLPFFIQNNSVLV